MRIFEFYQDLFRSPTFFNSIINMIIIIFISVSTFILSYSWLFEKEFALSIEEKAIIVVFLSLSLILLIFRYLQTGTFIGKPMLRAKHSVERVNLKPLYKNIDDQNNKFEILKDSVNDLRDEISTLSSSKFEISDHQKESVIDDLKKQIKSSAKSQYLDELKQEMKIEIEESSKTMKIDESCENTIKRIAKENMSLTFRANLNLALGIVTTIVGLIILSTYVSKISIDVNTPLIAILNFLPRLSLVLLIELFAFFFLKLYKSSLDEIKYFQNELTNIEAKYISLRTALLNSDDKTISEIVKNLADTERNFILEKGQSTVNLEKSKISIDATNSITKSISEIISSIKKA